jgi:hypothetical protein
MQAAVRNYAAYRLGANAWALGRFVVPAARLPELEACTARLADDSWPRAPLRVSAVLGANPEADLDVTTQFTDRQRRPETQARLTIDSVEMKVSTPSAVRSLAGSVPAVMQAVFEVPLDTDTAEWLEAVAQSAGVAKARLGGVVADGFPSTCAVAAWLWEAAEADVRLKATAGLHHPLRGEYRTTPEQSSSEVTMHGFLNVLVGALVARRLKGTVDRATGISLLDDLLRERSAAAFRTQSDRIRWRDTEITADELSRARSVIVGFGSCSFEEPLADLAALGLVDTARHRSWATTDGAPARDARE